MFLLFIKHNRALFARAECENPVTSNTPLAGASLLCNAVQQFWQAAGSPLSTIQLSTAWAQQHSASAQTVYSAPALQIS
jgi:hypothetical protein